jgi:hypothetical protein
MAPKPPLGHRWTRRDGKGLLGEAQQRRYMNQGLSESAYHDKRFSLADWRGHGDTPEHKPKTEKQLEKVRAKYPHYRTTINAFVKDGNQTAVVRISGLSKAQRSTVAKHHNAVIDYVEGKHPKGYVDRVPRTFKKHGLKIFEAKRYRDSASGDVYELETREDKIEEFARTHDIAFIDFYPKVK